jgi:hypothetical protein
MLHLDIVAKQQSLNKNIKYVAFSNASLSTKDTSYVHTRYNSAKVLLANSVSKPTNSLETSHENNQQKSLPHTMLLNVGSDSQTNAKEQNNNDFHELNMPTASSVHESDRFEIGEIETQCLPLKSTPKVRSALPTATWAIPLQNFMKASKNSPIETINSSTESCDVKELSNPLSIAKVSSVRTFPFSKQKLNGTVKKQKL